MKTDGFSSQAVGAYGKMQRFSFQAGFDVVRGMRRILVNIKAQFLHVFFNVFLKARVRA